MQELDRVGFIGAGLMGHGIIKNLIRHGYPVTFLEHPGNQPTADLIKLGANVQAAVERVSREADVLFICVTDSTQVENVVFGAHNILEVLKPGQIVIDCSTIDPETTMRVAAALEDKGAGFLDAPLTRTPLEAEAGRLNVMVGGDADTLERVRPLLACFAENVYHAGPVGAGHTLKLLHNYVSLGNAVVLAEAAVCAKRSGMDIGVFLEVLAAGGGDSIALQRLKPYLTDGDASAFRFSLANSLKDMRYYTQMATRRGATAIVADAIAQVFETAAARGSGSDPLPTIIDVLDQPRNPKINAR
ncbi:MAG: NAD(P)-dependent oxidoreductase [Gammaproteobacteria bacterium]|nr:NAD(P)-dependent oxidoreductase [Gammaproteobacteria bacterium]